MLKTALGQLLQGESLSREQMAQAVGQIMEGEASPALTGAFLVALRIKGETSEEIAGAATAMRQRMARIQTNRSPLVDTCGTGGDGSGTFNISTAVAFVVAAAGVGVAKHGNRAVSSRSGSADVLAAAGVNILASHQVVERCLNELGICFLFAPSCHPAMKHAAPIRKELGIRTIFNALGPLTNPAGAKQQLLGVFDRRLTRPMAEVLGSLGSERAWVVHGADGLDEITVCDVTYVAEWTGAEVVERELKPEDVGLERAPAEALKGGTAEENAQVLRKLLAGSSPGPLCNAIALNAGAALVVAGAAPDLENGLSKAQELIAIGKPLQVLDSLCALSQGQRA